MSPKRRDRVAPPPVGAEWDVIFGDNESAKGWEDLCAQAPGNTRDAWFLMRTRPGFRHNARHHRLHHPTASRRWHGEMLPQWQIEVTSGGRIWYLVDKPRRQVIVVYASTRHPKETE